MSEFIQLHIITAYPPSNLNRDDLGRPKTAIMGGRQRLRISSQSLKRAWRTSDVFPQHGLTDQVGTRTKEMGCKVLEKLISNGVEEKKAKEWAGKIASVFGKLKKDGLEIEQLAHFSPEEEASVMALAGQLIGENRAPDDNDLNLLQKKHTAVDIAMFGRMLASSPAYNMEAAVQVAHAVTVHETVVEEDFFTAVDDLNEGQEDLGAGHMGEFAFGAGVFYIYICVNYSLLKENLSSRAELAPSALKALTEAAAVIPPSGKQNSFASRAYASYLMAEKGDRQPRSLAAAFLNPVKGPDILTQAIERLEKTVADFDRAYGDGRGTTKNNERSGGSGIPG